MGLKVYWDRTNVSNNAYPALSGTGIQNFTLSGNTISVSALTLSSTTGNVLTVSGNAVVSGNLNVSGDINITKSPGYTYNGSATINVNRNLFAFINATGSGKIIKVMRIYGYVKNSAAVTGISQQLEAYRVSGIATGASAIPSTSAINFDTADAALPTTVSAMAAGVGTITVTLVAPTSIPFAAGTIYTEEAANSVRSPTIIYDATRVVSQTRILTLRENEGFVVKTGPVGAAGTVVIAVDFITV